MPDDPQLPDAGTPRRFDRVDDEKVRLAARRLRLTENQARTLLARHGDDPFVLEREAARLRH